MEGLKVRYWKLWAAAPPSPRRLPTDDELRNLRAHKQKVKRFWSELSPEEKCELNREVKLEKLLRERQRREAQKAHCQKQSNSRSQRNGRMNVRPKDRNFPLWSTNEAFRFHTTIPFCKCVCLAGDSVAYKAQLQPNITQSD